MIEFLNKVVSAFMTDSWLSGVGSLFENYQQYFKNQEGAKEGGE